MVTALTDLNASSKSMKTFSLCADLDRHFEQAREQQGIDKSY